MKPPKINFHFNGCKICHINKKNLLYVNKYTHVMMLVMDKKWKKPLNNLCGLKRGLLSNIWIACYLWMGAHM
jgi:hypothetical protein